MHVRKWKAMPHKNDISQLVLPKVIIWPNSQAQKIKNLALKEETPK